MKQTFLQIYFPNETFLPNDRKLMNLQNKYCSVSQELPFDQLCRFSKDILTS